jgi:hypothetical protein
MSQFPISDEFVAGQILLLQNPDETTFTVLCRNVGVAKLPKPRPLNSIGPIKSESALAENGIAGRRIFSRFTQKVQNRVHPRL